MSDYRHGSHTTFAIHLHIVWITKYRHKVLRGEVAERVRAIVREECRKSGVDILQGHISPDHVHVMISIPPQVTIRRLIQRMKGKSSSRLLAEFPHMRKRFWGRHVWRGATSAAAAAMSLTRSSKRTLRHSRTTVMTCFGSRVRRPPQGTPR